MGKSKKIIAIVLLAIVALSAGTIESMNSGSGHRTWAIKPACLHSASDTIGPIFLNDANYFSVNFNFKALTHLDTAIIDSGIIVKFRTSPSRNPELMCIPNTADSTVKPFDSNDTLTTRTKAISKGLTLDQNPFGWIVFERWDTNADTLDFVDSSGVLDTAMTFGIRFQK